MQSLQRFCFGVHLPPNPSRSLSHPYWRNWLGKIITLQKNYFVSSKITFSRGHDVTAVIPFKEKTNKYKIIWSDPDSRLMKELAKGTEGAITKQDDSTISVMNNMKEFIFYLSDTALGDPHMQELLKNPNTKFDLVIVQPFVGAEVGYYLAHRFKAPSAIYLTAQSALPFINTALGQPYNPAYMPLPLNNFVFPMTFFQRVINTVSSFLFEHVGRKYFILSIAYRALDKHFPGEIIPDLLELERNASLAFTFGHPLILDGWSPMAPNYVQLGMMNCRPAKELPPNDDIGNFLKKSKNGVVFMSFGSVIQPYLMPKEVKELFLNVFRRFPQYDFIWKWDDQVPEAPNNVLISSWLPQQEILGHPNLKVFITHGGQSSFQETLCHQKPTVGIPLTGDQPLNAKEMERLGFGINLPYRDLTEEDLFTALDQVLHNPKYSEAAKAIGSLANDQINRPLDRAVWWIEHVIRHPTMYAGRSPVHKLSWYQYFLLDVLLFFVVIIFIAFKVLKLLFGLCCGKRNKTKRD